MDSRDQNAIDQLFAKIDAVARQAGPRDSEAEAYLRAHLAQNPAAAYYMAQTIIVQEQALNAAQARIDALENEPAQRSGGGLLDSIFGGAARRGPGRGAQRPGAGIPNQQPWGGSPGMAQGMGGGMGRPGGGFLAGAAQTAMGVAGGVVLGNMLADWLSPDQAAAAGVDQDAGSGAEEGGWFGGNDAADTQVADTSGDFGGDFDVGDF